MCSHLRSIYHYQCAIAVGQLRYFINRIYNTCDVGYTGDGHIVNAIAVFFQGFLDLRNINTTKARFCHARRNVHDFLEEFSVRQVIGMMLHYRCDDDISFRSILTHRSGNAINPTRCATTDKEAAIIVGCADEVQYYIVCPAKLTV